MDEDVKNLDNLVIVPKDSMETLGKVINAATNLVAKHGWRNDFDELKMAINQMLDIVERDTSTEMVDWIKSLRVSVKE